MIKEDLAKGLLISGTGRKYHFDSNLYIKVKNFIMDFHQVQENQATDVINYYLVTKWLHDDSSKKVISKKVVNARLNNIITLEYEWHEFFNN